MYVSRVSNIKRLKQQQSGSASSHDEIDLELPKSRMETLSDLDEMDNEGHETRRW